MQRLWAGLKKKNAIYEITFSQKMWVFFRKNNVFISHWIPVAEREVYGDDEVEAEAAADEVEEGCVLDYYYFTKIKHKFKFGEMRVGELPARLKST